MAWTSLDTTIPISFLLDLHLPGLEGEEVLERLKADRRTCDIPVVVMSADATESRIRRVLSAGAHEYITKPLNVRRFLEVVEGVLSDRNGDHRAPVPESLEK